MGEGRAGGRLGASQRHLPSKARSRASSGSGSASRWSVPTSTKEAAGGPLAAIKPTESSNGTTSSARECRITVSGFTVVAVQGWLDDLVAMAP